MRLVVRIGERQIGAAGADVDDEDRTALLRHAADLDECGAAEDLGFLARDQRLAAREELEAEESLALGEVRERHAGLLPLDERAQALEALAIELRKRGGQRPIGGHRCAAGGAPQRGKQPLRGLFGLVGKRRPEALDLLQEVAEGRRGGDLHRPCI